MQVQLTQEERKVLEDHKKHEEVCIQKYDQYAQKASDPQLRNMFSQFASQERQHHETLSQLLQGQQPSTGGGSGQGQQQSRPAVQNSGQNPRGSAGQDDALMCQDAMMMEKFISDSYDNGIFASTNPTVRQALQHIQDEEQEHGEGLLNYLQNHGLQSS